MSAENIARDRIVSKWHNFCHDSNMLRNVLYTSIAAITPNICFCMMQTMSNRIFWTSYL